eukprot:6196474-Pleurochrysis_carterae.AAC.4
MHSINTAVSSVLDKHSCALSTRYVSRRVCLCARPACMRRATRSRARKVSTLRVFVRALARMSPCAFACACARVCVCVYADDRGHAVVKS